MKADDRSPDGLGIAWPASTTGPGWWASRQGVATVLGPVAWSALEMLALAAKRAGD